VVVIDSDYSPKTFLSEQSQQKNLVVVTRVRSNRVFYQSPQPIAPPSKGHPKWYGAKFDLKDEATWHEVTEIAQTQFSTKRGRVLQVQIQSWSDMLMGGSHECPMHLQPFTLMRILSVQRGASQAEAKSKEMHNIVIELFINRYKFE